MVKNEHDNDDTTRAPQILDERSRSTWSRDAPRSAVAGAVHARTTENEQPKDPARCGSASLHQPHHSLEEAAAASAATADLRTFIRTRRASSTERCRRHYPNPTLRTFSTKTAAEKRLSVARARGPCGSLLPGGPTTDLAGLATVVPAGSSSSSVSGGGGGGVSGSDSEGGGGGGEGGVCEIAARASRTALRTVPSRRKRQRARGGVVMSAVAAAAAAVVAGFASAPIGVGAMTEAQCVGAVLLGTEEELSASPRNDTSTEAAAAGVDGTVVASQVRSESRNFSFRRMIPLCCWFYLVCGARSSSGRR